MQNNKQEEMDRYVESGIVGQAERPDELRILFFPSVLGYGGLLLG
jgi:hypothetical protein